MVTLTLIFIMILLIFVSFTKKSVVNNTQVSNDISKEQKPENSTEEYGNKDNNIEKIFWNDSESYYMKDSDYVYCLFNDDNSDGKIESSDVSTFEILSPMYAKDKNNVYFTIGGGGPCHSGGGYFTIIDNADPESFELIYLNIGKDKHNVYYGGDEGVKVLNNADPSSFTVLTINDGLGGQPYASDIDTVFFSDIEIEDADTNSFVPISNVYSKDDNNVYYCQYSGCFDRECKIITDSDPTSFKVSSNDYIGLDKNYVYSAGEVIKNADPNSFQIIDDYRAEDKINKYRISCDMGGCFMEVEK